MAAEGAEKVLRDEFVNHAVCGLLGRAHPMAAFVCEAGVVLRAAKNAEEQEYLKKIRSRYNDSRINLAASLGSGLPLSENTLQEQADSWGGTIWRDLRNVLWHPDPEFSLPSAIPDRDIYRSVGRVCTTQSVGSRRNRYPGAPTIRPGR